MSMNSRYGNKSHAYGAEDLNGQTRDVTEELTSAGGSCACDPGGNG